MEPRTSARGERQDPRLSFCANDDTITGQEMLGLSRGVPQRIAASAFQAECRGFETRLPLQTPRHAWHDIQPCALALGIGRGATAIFGLST